MDLNIHFVDQPSGFSWHSLIIPIIQGVIVAVGVWLANRQKAKLDILAADQQRAFDRERDKALNDLEHTLQSHQKEMDKQKARYEAELQRVTLHFQSHFTYIAEKRVAALESFLKGLDEILADLRRNHAKPFDEAAHKELDKRINTLWNEHRVKRLFFSSTLTSTMFNILGILEQMHIEKENEKYSDNLSSPTMQQSSYRNRVEWEKLIERLVKQVIAEAQEMWGAKLQEGQTPGTVAA